MAFAVLSGFALAAAAPLLIRHGRGAAPWLIAMLPLGLTAYFARFVDRIAGGEVVVQRYRWVPALEIDLAFTLDGLSLLFALLISGIGTLIMVYAGGYLAGHPHQGRLYAFLLSFMASMLGLVLAADLITLFVFWELTTITSYLLIGFEHRQATARAAALQSLLVTVLGGQAMLAGFVLLGHVGGGFDLMTLLDRGEVVRDHRLYLPILLLVLLGAFTKSAQAPFHFWLPSAMEAPTPVSAYLHSATMVKAGVFLLLRLTPVLGGTDSWRLLLTATGAVTMLAAIVLALLQTDLKRILAYTTVSALGILVFLIGLGTELAFKAAIVFLVAHSLYKGALFLVAGAVDHETGTRDVVRLGGLRRAMPITAAAASVAALSMAGLPPLLGFIGKELALKSVLNESETVAAVLATVVTVTAAISVAVAGLVGLQPFVGRSVETPRSPHEAPLSLWLGPVVLAGLGLLFGVAPAVIGTRLIAPAVVAGLGSPAEVKVQLWEGFDLALALSTVAVAAGAVLYLGRQPISLALHRLELAGRLAPTRGYLLALDGLNWLARAQTRLLQSGYLRVYLATIVLTMVGLVGVTLVRENGHRTVMLAWSDVRPYEATLAALILAAALFTTLTASRLAAVAALGVVGYGVALLYVFFGAPDLAMTQFLVDTLTVILFVLVLYRLPRFAKLSSRRARLRDAVIALAAGGVMTTLVLVAAQIDPGKRVSTFFQEQSVPAAKGRNIVNVILVDFRALDTLGEITVLALAGLGVYALMKLRLDERER